MDNFTNMKYALKSSYKSEYYITEFASDEVCKILKGRKMTKELKHSKYKKQLQDIWIHKTYTRYTSYKEFINETDSKFGELSKLLSHIIHMLEIYEGSSLYIQSLVIRVESADKQLLKLCRQWKYVEKKYINI